MNILLDQVSIRVRLNNSEFDELKNKGQTSQYFAYWPLQVTIFTQPEAKVSTLSGGELIINFTVSEVDLLISPDTKKSGLPLLAQGFNKQEITLDIQVDLHSK